MLCKCSACRTALIETPWAEVSSVVTFATTSQSVICLGFGTRRLV